MPNIWDLLGYNYQPNGIFLVTWKKNRYNKRIFLYIPLWICNVKLPGQPRVKKGVLGSQSYKMPCREGEWGVIGLYLETWSEQHCRAWPLPSAPAQSWGGCDRCKRYTCCRCTCSVTWRGCRNTHRQEESVSCHAFPQDLDPKVFAIPSSGKGKVGLEVEGCRKVSTRNQ